MTRDVISTPLLHCADRTTGTTGTMRTLAREADECPHPGPSAGRHSEASWTVVGRLRGELRAPTG